MAAHERKLPDPEILLPHEVTLRRAADGRLVLRIRDGEEYRGVRVYNPLPFEERLRFVCFSDRKGKTELCMLRLDEGLDSEVRRLIEEELANRYLTASILRILDIELQGHTSYWRVETDRGAREFALNNINQNVLQPSPGYMVITDVHENRFVIKDLDALDPKSKKLLDSLI